jgi:hypothetical protein
MDKTGRTLERLDVGDGQGLLYGLHGRPEDLVNDLPRGVRGRQLLLPSPEPLPAVEFRCAANVWKLVDRDGGCSRAKFDDTDLLERS